MESVLANGVADALEDLVRRDVLADLDPTTSRSLAGTPLSELMVTYLAWRMRWPSPRPREVLLAPELRASNEFRSHEAVVRGIVKAIERGDDLSSHLSKDVRHVIQPTTAGSRAHPELDRLMSDWGILHLHLSEKLEPDGFVTRTRELLFAIFVPESAHLLAILPHGASTWIDEDLVRVAVENWPDAGLFHKAAFVTGLESDVTAEERARLRNAGVAVPLVVDGALCLAPSQTTVGTPSAATMNANFFMNQIAQLKRLLADSPEDLEAVVKTAGGNLTVPPSWTACKHEGWYGLLEDNTGVFVTVVEVPEWLL